MWSSGPPVHVRSSPRKLQRAYDVSQKTSDAAALLTLRTSIGCTNIHAEMPLAPAIPKLTDVGMPLEGFVGALVAIFARAAGRKKTHACIACNMVRAGDSQAKERVRAYDMHQPSFHSGPPRLELSACMSSPLLCFSVADAAPEFFVPYAVDCEHLTLEEYTQDLLTRLEYRARPKKNKIFVVVSVTWSG